MGWVLGCLEGRGFAGGMFGVSLAGIKALLTQRVVSLMVTAGFAQRGTRAGLGLSEYLPVSTDEPTETFLSPALGGVSVPAARGRHAAYCGVHWPQGPGFQE
jgi:hypothetical protein